MTGYTLAPEKGGGGTYVLVIRRPDGTAVFRLAWADQMCARTILANLNAPRVEAAWA